MILQVFLFKIQRKIIILNKNLTKINYYNSFMSKILISQIHLHNIPDNFHSGESYIGNYIDDWFIVV